MDGTLLGLASFSVGDEFGKPDGGFNAGHDVTFLGNALPMVEQAESRDVSPGCLTGNALSGKFTGSSLVLMVFDHR